MAPPRFSGSPSLSTEALAQLLLPPLRSLENRLPAQGQGLLSASWSHPQARACPVSCSALFSLKGEERASLSVPVPFQEGLPSTDSFLPSLAFSVCHIITFQNGHTVLEKHFHPTPAASDLCVLGSKTGYIISLRWASCSLHSRSCLNLL